MKKNKTNIYWYSKTTRE